MNPHRRIKQAAPRKKVAAKTPAARNLSARAKVIAAVALSLFAGWSMLAYSGALSSPFTRTENIEQPQTVSPASFSIPSKAYIYAGGRLVATEEPTPTGPVPHLVTIGVYNPVTAIFSLRNSNSAGNADQVFTYGAANVGWLSIAGDWNTDGIDTAGLYNPTTSTFFLKNSHAGGNADITFGYGVPGAGWLPIAGDWNNDGMDTASTIPSPALSS